MAPLPDAARPPVVFERVTKRYRGGHGVADLDLRIERGEVFGFLGPNGAGKTTAIRLLLALIRPDAGRIEVLGHDVAGADPSWRRNVGYLPGDLALYERLTARQILGHVAHLRSVDAGDVAPLAERFGLDLDRPVRHLSRGNRQKVGIVLAFLGDPELLVLDEPAAGLDPLMQAELHRAIRERRDAGATVLLSSHGLAEVDRVADRIGMIRDGRLATVDDVAVLRSRAIHRVELRTRGPVDRAVLERLDGVRDLEVDDDDARFGLAGGPRQLLAALAGVDVLDLTIQEPDLEDVFLALYRGDGPGDRFGNRSTTS